MLPTAKLGGTHGTEYGASAMRYHFERDGPDSRSNGGLFRARGTRGTLCLHLVERREPTILHEQPAIDEDRSHLVAHGGIDERVGFLLAPATIFMT